MPEENLSLPEKADRSRERLRRVARSHEPSSVYVAWTGGKDSTVVLWLWQTVLRDLFPESGLAPRALRVDTGQEFPELREFCRNLRQQWDLAETLVCPSPERIPTVPGRDPVACCRELKIEPLRDWVSANRVQVLLTGLRRDEHPGRSERSVFETRQDPHYVQVNPILEWGEMDIWTLILTQSLPYCNLYDQGYRSLDCRPCTERSAAAERGGRNPEKESQMELLRGLGYF
jgi:phosphoadenosine phosphosulfate reductase